MELQEFRADMDRLKGQVAKEELEYALYCFLTTKRNQLPLFPAANLVQWDNIKRIYTFERKTYQKELRYAPGIPELFVEPILCIGTTWLYRNDRTDGYPKPDRLSRSLSFPVETAPPVQAERLGNKFMCNDGNHRIYAAYLLGKKVKIQIMGEHDLISFS